MLDGLQVVHLVQLQVYLVLSNERVLRYQLLDKLETIGIQLALTRHQSYLLRPLLRRGCLTLLCKPFLSSRVGDAVLLPPLKNGFQLFEISVVFVCDSADSNRFLGHVGARLLHLFELLDDHLHILLAYSLLPLFRTATAADGAPRERAEGITHRAILWQVFPLLLQLPPQLLVFLVFLLHEFLLLS